MLLCASTRFVFHARAAALRLVVQVNGQPTPDLDTFLSVVSPLKDGDFARVKVCHLETTQQKVIQPHIITSM